MKTIFIVIGIVAFLALAVRFLKHAVHTHRTVPDHKTVHSR